MATESSTTIDFGTAQLAYAEYDDGSIQISGKHFATAADFEKLDQQSAWIPWAGGEMPLPKGTAVECKYRNGKTSKSFSGFDAMEHSVSSLKSELAFSYCWNHTGSPGDIIAYRILSQPVITPTQPNFCEGDWAPFGKQADPNQAMIDRDKRSPSFSGRLVSPSIGVSAITYGPHGELCYVSTFTVDDRHGKRSEWQEEEM